MNIIEIVVIGVIGFFIFWIALIVFLAIWGAKRQKRKKQESMRSPEQVEEFLAETHEELSVTKLLSWDENTINEITFGHKNAFARGKFYTQYERGLLLDIHQQPKIAYALFDNSKDYSKAKTRIKTTEFSLDLIYNDQGGFKLFNDKILLGRYKLEGNIGYIYDARGKEIADIERIKGRIHASSIDIDLVFTEISFFKKYENTHQHYPIDFRSGLNGSMTDRRTEIKRDHALVLNRQANEMEQKWLIALIVHENTFHYEDYIFDY